MAIHCFANGKKNGALFHESFRSKKKIKTAFFFPSDLVNTKTTIPLRVGEERWKHTSTLRVSVYIHHYSPPLRGIVVYYYNLGEVKIKPMPVSSDHGSVPLFDIRLFAKLKMTCPCCKNLHVQLQRTQATSQ